MAKTRKNVRSNRRKGSGRRPIVSLLAAVAIVAAAVVFYILTTGKSPKLPLPQPPVSKPQVAERHKMPPHEPEAPIVHEDYTGIVAHPPESHPRVRISGAGTLAIIVDDMGKSVQEAKSLLDIGVPLTFSIIPGLPKVRQVAEEARKNGAEVMIHIPMEPKGYPRQRLEENGLLLSQSSEELSGRVEAFLREIPGAAGANNHMGSRFTEDREKMRTVIEALKGKGLFFVDSKTSPASVGYDVAREIGVKTAVRNVFLDNVQDVGAITKQLNLAANMARKRGSAIAICHPHPTTIQALAAALPRLQEEGITFVHVSRLVR